MGLSTLNSCRIFNPKIPPLNPTKVTTPAVIGGIPPIDWLISRAMGVVTDLEAIERITSGDAPNHPAIVVTETIHVTQPANCETRIGRYCFLIISRF